MRGMLEQFLYDLEMHEQNRNKKRTEIEWFDWFIERIQMHMGFGSLSKWGVCQNLSDRDDWRIFGGLKFLILGFFWVGKF